jgi:hypothetical protein
MERYDRNLLTANVHTPVLRSGESVRLGDACGTAFESRPGAGRDLALLASGPLGGDPVPPALILHTALGACAEDVCWRKQLFYSR